jgi:hypothetical protein
MKRYLVFGFATYYPSGGMEDFLGSFDEQADAENKAISFMMEDSCYRPKTHIFDSAMGLFVWSRVRERNELPSGNWVQGTTIQEFQV